MSKLLIGNQKAYLTYDKVLNFIEKIRNLDMENVVLCPTNIYLSLFRDLKINLGVQNISSSENGAQTGETPANLLKGMKVGYVIIGHSERRINNNENNKIIKEKLKKASKESLNIILCVGEDEKEYSAGKTFEILKQQMEVLDLNLDFSKLIIAYEPVWAIGTGNVASNSYINKVSGHIKNEIKLIFEKEIRVLYGGSVNSENIEELVKIKNIDGFLVGKASSDATELIKMQRVINEKG